MVNSHVYIAESILNRFCIRDKDNRKIINYFDFKNNTIASSTTKKFNTSYGYYTEKNESILKSKAEEKIGNIIKNIENGNLTIDEKQEKFIRKYAKFQFIRDESTAELIKNSDSYNNLFDAPYSNESIIKRFSKIYYLKNVENSEIKNIVIGDNNISKNIDEIFDLYCLQIINNRTNYDFLLTSNFTKYDNKNFSIIDLTLSPKILICFIPRNIYDNKCEIQKLYDDSTIRKRNCLLFANAKINKPNILVGNKIDLQNAFGDYKLNIKNK